MKSGPSLERETGRHQGTEGRLHGASPLLFNPAFVSSLHLKECPRRTSYRHQCQHTSPQLLRSSAPPCGQAASGEGAYRSTGSEEAPVRCT